MFIYTLRFREKEKSSGGGKGNYTQVGQGTAVQVCW